MKTRISRFEFEGTKEQEEKLLEVIREHKGKKVSLMPVMQKAQAIYGYLPIEVQKIIATNLDVPLEDIFGVSTFYSQFNLEPKGEYEIAVCMGTACYVKGAGAVLDKFIEQLGIKPEETTKDGKFTLTASRCIGACGLAPVITVNDEVHGKLTVDDVENILSKYKD